MPIINIPIFVDQVEKGLQYAGDYWELVKKWELDEDIVPSPIGLKCQVIQPVAKRKIKSGDKLTLRDGSRIIGKVVCCEAFTIGVDIDPNDFKPYPSGKSEFWKSNPVYYKKQLYSYGARIFGMDVEDLAKLEGFNKYPTEYAIYTAEDIDKYRTFFERHTQGHLPVAGVDKYIVPDQRKNAIDLAVWLNEQYGKENGLHYKYFQVIRWNPPVTNRGETEND